MSKHMAPSAPEFRAEAIRLARTSGKPHAQIARELGMTGETLPDAGSNKPIWTRGSAVMASRATSRRSCSACDARTAFCGRSARS